MTDTDALVLNERAVLLIQAGKLHEAGTILDHALASGSVHAALSFNRGLVYERLGEDAAAEKMYHRSLASDPKSARSLVHLGNILTKTNRLDAADQYYRAALAYDQEFFPALYNRAALLELRGLSEDASRCYQQAVAVDKTYSEAWLGLARTVKTADIARHALERALETAQGGEALFSVGHIAAKLGNLTVAREALARVVARDPRHARGRYTLAVVEWFLGEREDALSHVNRATRDARIAGQDDVIERCEELLSEIRGNA